MAREQIPAGDSQPEIDPELLGDIESIEADVLQPGDDSLELRVFQDYYNNLQEVSSVVLQRAFIEYTDSDGDEYHINAIGVTPYGQLCEMTRIEDKKKVGQGYAILCGSLVLNAQFDDLSEEEKNVLSIVYSTTPEERKPLKMEGTRYAVFTKGLCQDGYFVFFIAIPWEEHEDQIIGEDRGFSEPERGFILTVKHYGTGRLQKYFVRETPIITQEKVQEFTVCEPQDDTVVYHHIG